LRDAYYTFFEVPSLIAEKNACSGFGPCPSPPFDDCSGSCDLTDLPPCLLDCNIRELGNAIYVDSANGLPDYPGTRELPINSLVLGVERANKYCGALPLIAVEPASYPGPCLLSDPAVLIPAGCERVVLGR
jgi:hypothetical protein